MYAQCFVLWADDGDCWMKTRLSTKVFFTRSLYSGQPIAPSQFCV